MKEGIRNGDNKYRSTEEEKYTVQENEEATEETRQCNGRRMKIRQERRKKERRRSLARVVLSEISLALRSAAGQSRSMYKIPRSAGPLPGPS